MDKEIESPCDFFNREAAEVFHSSNIQDNQKERIFH